MSRLKHEFQARYLITVVMVNYISREVFKDFDIGKKNVQSVLVLR